MKKVLDIIESIISYICLALSKGFFFYFYLIAFVLEKIFPISLFKNIKLFFKKRQEDTISFLFLVLLFFAGVFIYTYFYVDNSVVHVSREIISGKKSNTKINSNDLNLYRRYSSYDINSVDFNEFKDINNDFVYWLMVDGTNINYPIVQGKDNDYYLNHDIKGNMKSSGWVFMDYRNDLLNDDNTIIYGHNLPNKTAFGSLNNLFSDDWFNNSNHYIVIRYLNQNIVYEVFSLYEVDPEIYYLQNNFYKNEYKEFLDTIKSRSKYNFNVEVDSNSKILTLSTCTSDNKRRRVVHAKKIK